MDTLENISQVVERRRQLAVSGARSAVAKLKAMGVETSVFGSLASGGFSQHSDIDLLVTKCPQHLKYAIEGIVEDSLEGFRFDVVYLDEIPVSKRNRFLKEAMDAIQLR